MAGGPPWWADWAKSVSLVIAGGGLTVLGNWLTHRWTLMRERKRTEHETRLKHDFAWVELQQDSLLQAQAAIQEYLTSCMAFLAERAGQKPVGGEAGRITSASHTLIVMAARLDDVDLAERIEAWRREMFAAVSEAGRARRGVTDEKFDGLADRADELSRELGKQAREVVRRSVERREPAAPQAELDKGTGSPKVEGSDG